jgi:hypothetical protein
MSRVLAGAITSMIMGVMVWVALHRSSSQTDPAAGSGSDSRLHDSLPSSRELATRARLQRATDRVEILLASVRDGDVSTYFGCFGGTLRARLKREADELGGDIFAARLRSSGEARKSHAVFAPEPDMEHLDRVRITVESALANRLERQTFCLEQASGGWLITDVETAREHVPRYLLGSLAAFEQPEGIPETGATVEPSDGMRESLGTRSNPARP